MSYKVMARLVRTLSPVSGDIARGQGWLIASFPHFATMRFASGQSRGLKPRAMVDKVTAFEDRVGHIGIWFIMSRN